MCGYLENARLEHNPEELHMPYKAVLGWQTSARAVTERDARRADAVT